MEREGIERLFPIYLPPHPDLLPQGRKGLFAEHMPDDEIMVFETRFRRHIRQR